MFDIVSETTPLFIELIHLKYQWINERFREIAIKTADILIHKLNSEYFWISRNVHTYLSVSTISIIIPSIIFNHIREIILLPTLQIEAFHNIRLIYEMNSKKTKIPITRRQIPPLYPSFLHLKFTLEMKYLHVTIHPSSPFRRLFESLINEFLRLIIIPSRT